MDVAETRNAPVERPGRRDDPAGQLARFLVVGVGNTAVSFVVYRLLLLAGMPYLIAAPLAFAAGAINGYVFNRRWTFAARDTTRARILYVGVQVAGAASTSLCSSSCAQRRPERWSPTFSPFRP